MFTIIENIFTEDDISNIASQISTDAYTPGYETAGDRLKDIKKNLQNYNQTASDTAVRIIQRNKEFQQASFSKRMAPPMFALYLEGMEYGPHTDDAVMQTPRGVFRCDLAFTVFLNDPDDYEGGELVVNDGQPNQTFHKLKTGSMILYPANTKHCVMPVTKGMRTVLVSWCQSMFPDHEQRQIMHTLLQEPDKEELQGVYNKLARMWADI